MRTLLRVALAGTLLGPCSAVFAQSSADDALNACLQAAKQQHQGIVTGWTISKGGAGNEIDMTMVGLQDKTWKLVCTNGTLGDAAGRFGGMDYQMLSSRKAIPEVSARATATAAVANSTMQKMTYGLSWLGKPYYHYYFATEDGRTSQVDVNAETGQIDSTSSQRVSSSWW